MSVRKLAIAIFRFGGSWPLLCMRRACGSCLLVRGVGLRWFADYRRLFRSWFLTPSWGLGSTESLCGVYGEVFRCACQLLRVCSSVCDDECGLCMLLEVLNVFGADVVKSL